MISRTDLACYLEDYLACKLYQDYAPNGLQIEGRSAIKRICTAVTASQNIIERAVAWKADALLVHHGYFWRGEDAAIVGMKAKRIGLLLKNNLNLFAYHLPLDCHLDVGNNTCLGQLFELTDIKPHFAGKTPNLLWTGHLEKEVTAAEWCNVLAEKLQRQPLHVSGTDKNIQHIAWCSGGAQDYIEDAYRLGVDAYISGEISERTFYQAQEFGIHYFACGHHATERLGIQALGAHLVERFDLEHQFIDSGNPC